MKIAVLLTGQLRTWRMVGNVHMHSLFKQHDCDIFMSVDCDNSKQVAYLNKMEQTRVQEVEEAIAFYRPVRVLVNNTFAADYRKAVEQWESDKESNVELCSPFRFQGTDIMRRCQQYYVVQNAYRLLREYKNETGINYDVIMRLRFDQFIWVDQQFHMQFSKHNGGSIPYTSETIEISRSPSISDHIIFKDLRDNTVYVFGSGVFGSNKWPYVNDQFFYHNESVLHVMEQIFDRLPFSLVNRLRVRQYNACLTESSIRHFFESHGLAIAQSVVKGIFIRELTEKVVPNKAA